MKDECIEEVTITVFPPMEGIGIIEEDPIAEEDEACGDPSPGSLSIDTSEEDTVVITFGPKDPMEKVNKAIEAAKEKYFPIITKEGKTIHPVTGEAITGFAIPYWKEVVELAKNAALCTPENRSVGWDIAVTAEGPELIEGNHNWCKLLWQLPVKQGLKKELEKYL